MNGRMSMKKKIETKASEITFTPDEILTIGKFRLRSIWKPFLSF